MIRAPFLCVMTTLLLSTMAQAQGVLVAPHAVIMDHRTRSGSLTLYNPGDDPVEITFSSFFGYPVSDSIGGFELRTVQQPGDSFPSGCFGRCS